MVWTYGMYSMISWMLIIRLFTVSCQRITQAQLQLLVYWYLRFPLLAREDRVRTEELTPGDWTEWLLYRAR